MGRLISWSEDPPPFCGPLVQTAASLPRSCLPFIVPNSDLIHPSSCCFLQTFSPPITFKLGIESQLGVSGFSVGCESWMSQFCVCGSEAPAVSLASCTCSLQLDLITSLSLLITAPLYIQTCGRFVEMLMQWGKGRGDSGASLCNEMAAAHSLHRSMQADAPLLDLAAKV